MYKKLLLAVLLFGSSLFAGSITIAVAANVSYAIEALKKEFKTLYPNTEVKVILGSSGKLTAQIKNGAPYQVFMAADMKYPFSLYDDGVAVTKPRIYAQGGLAYLSIEKQDFSKGINIVKESKISKIAVANPKTAPYGKAAVEAMKNGGVYDEAVKKLIYAESASQTVSYVVIAASLGFIAKSALYSPKMTHYKKGINWAEVDTKLYTPINQGIVILKNGETSSETAAFYSFIFSKKAAKIFNDFGYVVP